MESRNLGLIRALGWERTRHGVEFRCATELLAAARVAVEVAGPRAVRVRITAGATPSAKAFTYVVDRPAADGLSVEAAEGRVVVRTRHLAVEAALDPWQLTFRGPDGRLLTHQVQDDVNFAGHRLGPRPGLQAESLPHDPARRTLAVQDTLLLDPEDHFYGGGEKFTRLDHVGRSIRIWNRNPYGSRSELAYKNIPVLVGSRGYGIFVDVPTAVSFHVGSRSNRTFTIEAAGPELDYYVLAGTPKEVLGAYTDLTGKPPVPPEWAFGLWASTCFVRFTESSVLAEARRLREGGIPCDVFHLDSFWQRAFMWCDFEWDAERIPDPKRLMAELRRRGSTTASGSTPTSPARARSTRRAPCAGTSCAARTGASTTRSCGTSAPSAAWGSAPSSISPTRRPSAGTAASSTPSWRSGRIPSSRTSRRRSPRTLGSPTA
jgi:alpha-D-xyloside xylohydrolase